MGIMAFISASLVGSSFVSGSTATTNPPYNIVKLYGHSTVDKLRVVDYAMTSAEFTALSTADSYTWDEHTLLCAEFTNNLNAGSIVIPTTIDSWNIVRFISGSNVPENIAIGLDDAVTTITDYTAIKPNIYYYRVYPITATAVIAEIQSNTVTICYDYYAFLDETTGESFTFKSNIEPVGKQYNSPTTLYEGFSEYPAESQGVLKYHTFTFSGLLGNIVDGVYTGDTVADYEALMSFITNGNEKIMKDRKGHIYRVTTKNLTSNIDEKPTELPTMVSFECTEVGEV